MNTMTRLFVLSLPCLPLFAQAPPAKPTPAPAPAVAPKEQPPEQPKESKVLQLGQRASGSITLLDIDGQPQRAKDLMGKVTVINFYSIKCPIQAAWDQRLAAIQKEFEAQGVVFLHIDSNEDEIGKEPPQTNEGQTKPYENVRAHLAKKGLPFRVLVDHGNKVADLFGAEATPHVYVFGNDGRLVYRGLVDSDQRDKDPDGRKNYLRDTLSTLLKGDKVEPFATTAVGCGIHRVKAAVAAPARDGK
jgi:peroxiredoxin